jgi:hypothetical protein
MLSKEQGRMNSPTRRVLKLRPCMFALAFALGAMWVTREAHAAEVCGIGEITFRDGFEANAIPAPVVFADNAPLTLALDAGQNGSTVVGPTTTLSGTYSGPPGTGISARDRPAVRAGNAWFIRNLPLDVGANAITVTATTLAGATATQNLSITRDDAPAATARLSVETPERFAPGSVRLRLDLASSLVVTRLRVDFNGDGTQDIDTTNTATPLVFNYALPGLYSATAIVDLQPGSPGTPPNSFTRSTKVLVQNTLETREDVCAVFGAMRTRLVANDVPGALLALHPKLRPDFQTLWTSLGAGLPGVASQLGLIVDGTIGIGFAELLIARPVPGQPGEFYGYRVQFGRGRDGVWRISSM